MTRHEVVSEYIAGRIDRREFIRKLTLVGVSAGAAAVYADTLTQSVAAKGAARGARGYVTAFQDTGDYPVLDTDEDGYTDEEETECGSDPDDPNSTCEDVSGGGNGGGGGTGGGGTGGGGGGGTETGGTGTGSVSSLPNTGVGDARDGSSWLAPVAAAGAGLAVLARRIRRAGESS